jgi:H2-forming N5,N10-methylenetetrahydromethanopterin dehydrogenase-like enzyme
MPVRLEDLGDVLTDRDLVALMQWLPSRPRSLRDKAKALGIAPNLPAVIPGTERRPRYRRVDVERWLATGSSVPSRLRRVS